MHRKPPAPPRSPDASPRPRRARRGREARAPSPALGIAAVATGVLLLTGASALPAAAQGVPAALATLDRANGEAWVAPFTRALAPALTAGFFTSGGRGEGLALSVRVNAGRAASGDDRFDPVLPASVTFDGRTYTDPYVVEGGTAGSGGRAATVAGGATDARLVPRPGSPFEAALDAAGVPAGSRALPLPDGLDLSYAPLPLVEASLALRGLGIQLVGRFSPTVELFDELGDVSAFGGGVLLTVSRFLPVRPVDIGLSAVAQKLDGGDWLDASASAFGLVLSRDVGPLRAYAHGTLASSEIDVAWRVRNPAGLPLLPPDGTPQSFRRTHRSRGLLALGASLDLRALALSAEYQRGPRDVISVRATLLRR